MSGQEQKLAVLSVIFSGGLPLRQKLGDTEAMRALERGINRMERSVGSFNGTLVNSPSAHDRDEVKAVFTSVEDACFAACDIQQRVADLPPVCGVKLAVRIGFHMGPTQENEGDYSGAAPVLASQLAEMAEDQQVLISKATFSCLSPGLQPWARDRGRLSLPMHPEEALYVYEILWQEGGMLMPRRLTSAQVLNAMMTLQDEGEAAVPAASVGRLCIRYRGSVRVIDESHGTVVFGRDPASDLVIRDRRASRKHGTIMCRGGVYFITDMSTNGTYVGFNGDNSVIFVRHQEVPLHADGGRISFAAPLDSEDADIADFSFL